MDRLQTIDLLMPPEPVILFSDHALLVINKPAGLLSIPDGHDPTKPHLRGLLEPKYGPLWILHRLDKDTSGVILLARSAAAHRDINSQFSERQVIKIYHTIVTGTPPWEEETVQAPLRVNVGRRKRTVVDPQHGKPAVTAFSVLSYLRGHTLVEARPATGRTHQIRVHLYKLGYPVLADPLYGPTKPTPYIQRSALHAHSITLLHPQTSEHISFNAPYPDDFQNAITLLSSVPDLSS